jgi:hypothetical protein
MRVYYDTEFIDNGETIELISIGMVAEDGREYYAVVADLALMTRAWNVKSGGEFWLRNNVLNSLPIQKEGDHYLLWDIKHPDWKNTRTRKQIKEEVLAFLRATPAVEYWAWYAAYDHVALSQLFGRMLDLPNDLPMWTNDLRQELQRLGNPRYPEQQSGNHNALEDAKWNKVLGEYLAKRDGPVSVKAIYDEVDKIANPNRVRNIVRSW